MNTGCGSAEHHSNHQRSDRFILRVADALRASADPFEVQAIATRMLAEHLDASRVLYAELDEGERVTGHRDHVRAGSSTVGSYPWDVFMGSAMMRAWNEDRPWIVEDIEHDVTLGEEGGPLRAAEIDAVMAFGLKKEGKWVAGLGVHSATPRCWTKHEEQLVGEVAERTWVEVQRAHAEVALRASEQKYRSLFASIEEGFCILELVPGADGRARDVRYLESNSAFERQTGLANPVGRTYFELAGACPRQTGWWCTTRSLEQASHAEWMDFRKCSGAGTRYRLGASASLSCGAWRACSRT